MENFVKENYQLDIRRKEIQIDYDKSGLMDRNGKLRESYRQSPKMARNEHHPDSTAGEGTSRGAYISQPQNSTSFGTRKNPRNRHGSMSSMGSQQQSNRPENQNMHMSFGTQASSPKSVRSHKNSNYNANCKKEQKRHERNFNYNVGHLQSEPVFVCHIQSPNSFFIQRKKWSSDEKIQIQESCAKEGQSMTPPKTVNMNEIYLAMETADNKWQRCRVLQLLKAYPSRMYRIEYIDYGRQEDIDVQYLRECSCPLAAIESGAEHCSLYNIEPNGKNWEDQVNMIFSSIVNK